MASPVVDGCLTMRREVCLWEISDCDQSVGTQDSQEQGVEEDHAFNINVYCGYWTNFEIIIGFIFKMICIFCWAIVMEIYCFCCWQCWHYLNNREMTRCSFVAMILVPGGGLLLPAVIIKIMRGPALATLHCSGQPRPITKLAREDDQQRCQSNNLFTASNQTPPQL